jgi:hypothetical protein
MECLLFARTRKYGFIENEKDIFFSGTDDLYHEVINRNINTSYPLHVICNSIKNEIPSIEWQKQNLLDMSNRDLVSLNELKDVSSYSAYEYEWMNEELRFNPNIDASINTTINKMQGLDKDIVVFRHIKTYDYLRINLGGIFNSYGYLSTTMSGELITKTACTENGAVMRIHVSKGTKCIYIPGYEKELLFPHGIQLQLVKVSYNSFYCSGNTDNNIIVYDFVML